MSSHVVALVALFAICNTIPLAAAGASAACPSVEPTTRKECGYPDITPANCRKNTSCCFDDDVWDVIWCFVDPTLNCLIDVQSYSYTEEPCIPVDGFIKVNGRTVWESGYCLDDRKPKRRGVTITTFDPVSCAPGEFMTFDTFGNVTAGPELDNYLSGIPSESIVVGVTGDEPTKYLKPALPQLETAGVPVSDVKRRGSFAFVLQKGHPSKTQYVKSLTNTLTTLTTRLQVRVGGTSTDDIRIEAINNN